MSALQAAGFTVVVEKVPDASAPAGTVIDQTPSAGVLVEPGSSVTIIVAAGPGDVAEPVRGPSLPDMANEDGEG